MFGALLILLSGATLFFSIFWLMFEQYYWLKQCPNPSDAWLYSDPQQWVNYCTGIIGGMQFGGALMSSGFLMLSLGLWGLLLGSYSRWQIMSSVLISTLLYVGFVVFMIPALPDIPPKLP